ncbi:MAG: hypothetical protein HC837_18035 [Chloroflexaceae bacterium]|nr:hypothetical protein [Chloroflexaceae bacterium]
MSPQNRMQQVQQWLRENRMLTWSALLALLITLIGMMIAMNVALLLVTPREETFPSVLANDAADYSPWDYESPPMLPPIDPRMVATAEQQQRNALTPQTQGPTRTPPPVVRIDLNTLTPTATPTGNTATPIVPLTPTPGVVAFQPTNPPAYPLPTDTPVGGPGAAGPTDTPQPSFTPEPSLTPEPSANARTNQYARAQQYTATTGGQ